METVLISGNKLKEKKLIELKQRVEALAKKNIKPHLVVVQVGADPASTIYINHKEKTALSLGMQFTRASLPGDISYEDLKKEVDKYNNDSNVDGIIVQFPLPKHLDGHIVTTLVVPHKDADGLHPYNQGINFSKENEWAPTPCTPTGVMQMFKEYNIPLSGKNAVVIGRSNIVGRPMSYMLTHENATVSTLHSRTEKETFKRLIKNADVIVTATGVADMFTPDMIKEGATIIDVGIIRDENNKIRGDIAYKDFMGKAGYITPVPGGVGPMTVTLLMENTILFAEKYKG